MKENNECEHAREGEAEEREAYTINCFMCARVWSRVTLSLCLCLYIYNFMPRDSKPMDTCLWLHILIRNERYSHTNSHTRCNYKLHAQTQRERNGDKRDSSGSRGKAYNVHIEIEQMNCVCGLCECVCVFAHIFCCFLFRLYDHLLNSWLTACDIAWLSIV